MDKWIKFKDLAVNLSNIDYIDFDEDEKSTYFYNKDYFEMFYFDDLRKFNTIKSNIIAMIEPRIFE